jgi:hypothetical protein
VCVGVPTYQCAQVAVTAGSASAAAMAWQLLAQTGQAPARSKSDRPRRGRGGGGLRRAEAKPIWLVRRTGRKRKRKRRGGEHERLDR